MASAIQTSPRAVEVHTSGVCAPPATADAAAWAEFFDEVYREAAGDPARIPWAAGRADPSLQDWLNDVAPGLVRPGAAAVVVGCGLGDDARELADRGYEVTAFDVSPAAIRWARERHPDLSERFHVADLFSIPPSLCRRADLVVEAHTLQALHPELRARAAAGVASLARPRGTILAICAGREEGEPLPDSPPFPLCARELADLMSAHGFAPTGPIEDSASAGGRRLRAAFRRC